MNNTRHYFYIILLMSSLFSNDVIAAIASLKGDAKVKNKDSQKYLSAYKGQMIKNGDWLKTDNEVFVSLIFLDGTNVKIHQETEIEIKSSRITAKELKTNMYIAQGEAWSTVNKQGDGSFKIETPTAVASVKGTEFDVDYDFNSSLTVLTVISGEVEFGNDDIGLILAKSMEGSKIDKDTKEPSIYKISSDDVPKWKDNISSNWGFNIIPSKEGKIPINEPLRINVQVKNINNDSNANNFNSLIKVESENEFIMISKTSNNWSNKIDLLTNNGKGTFYLKSIKEGLNSVIISSKKSESQKLSIDFYQTESQKIDNRNKILELAKNKGYSDIVDAIENLGLESSKIILGNIDIDNVIQKIESNEYEIIKFSFNEKDGKVIVQLEIKPKNN